MKARQGTKSQRKERIKGWGWFGLPVFLNLIPLTLPTFDYGYTSGIIAYFSIPYFVVAAMIGIRRGSRLSVTDFSFLLLGNWAIVSLLWRWHQPHL